MADALTYTMTFTEEQVGAADEALHLFVPDAVNADGGVWVSAEMAEFVHTALAAIMENPDTKDDLLAARDAEWRRAIEAEKWTDHHPMCLGNGYANCCGMKARNAALDAVLARMEAK